MSKHTNLPWRVDRITQRPHFDDNPHYEFIVTTKTAEDVRTTGGEGLTICYLDNQLLDNNEANAALIVKAVNNFSDMEAALRAWYELEAGTGNGKYIPEQLTDATRTILAKLDKEGI